VKLSVFEKKYPGLRELLPTASAKELAEKYTLTDDAIRNMRKRFGVPALDLRRGPKPRPPQIAADTTERKYPGLLARLGKEQDIDLAKEYGLSRERIRQLRSRLTERPTYRAKAKAEIFDKLAALGDVVANTHSADLAKKTGLPEYWINQYKGARGIPALSAKLDLAPVKHLLGTMSDLALGRKLGHAASTIARAREDFGIPPFQAHSRWHPLPKDEIFKLFAEGKTDQEIAEAVDSSWQSIRHFRQVHGFTRRQKS
jgi:hypothetical protein